MALDFSSLKTALTQLHDAAHLLTQLEALND
jgi:hypothetical protein